MLKFKCTFKGLSIVVLIGLTIVGVAGSASALTMWSSSENLKLALTDVTKTNGESVTGDWLDWLVLFDSYLMQDFQDPTGDGIVDTSYIEGIGFLSVGDAVSLSTSASGKTGEGSADADVWTRTYLDIYNYSSYSLIFRFDYRFSYSVNASTDEEVDDPMVVADAGVFFWIDDPSSDVYEEYIADILNQNPDYSSLVLNGSFDVELNADESDYVLIDNGSFGHATGTAPTPVPEPATIFLLGVGLAGLGGASRLRKKSTT